MFKLEDFLPKYPLINDTIINPYKGESFEQVLFNKKEFRDQQLDKTMQAYTKGQLLKHQKIIAAFLSPYTPYDGLLLFHEMGVGKTCSAVGVAEMVSHHPNFQKSLIICYNMMGIQNFQDEIINNCTSGKYRTRRELTQHFIFYTIETFANHIREFSVEKIKERYSNRSIVIDEVHHLRPGLRQSLYEIYYKFLHSIENKKVLLMSGTVMRDSALEFASIINLLLPEQEKFDEKSFTKKFLDEKGIFKEERKREFKDKIKGRVSYLKAPKEHIQISYIGDIIPPLRYLSVNQNIMKRNTLQYAKYLEVYRQEKDTLYSTSIQESIAHSDLFNNLYKLQGLNNNEKLLFLENYSQKFADTIRIILENPRKAGLVFCEFLEMGIYLFAKVLDYFAYTKVDSSDALTTEKLRYILLSGESSVQKIKAAQALFNNQNNANGEYVHLVIGSYAISEGLSFKNIQQVHILTPDWNFTTTRQAIYRGLRLFSHKDLKNPEYKIYLHVSIPEGRPQDSIDLKMYSTSEMKDISMKSIERILKETSFDCALMKNRNQFPSTMDGTQECDYQICKYECDGIISENQDIDVSTYQLFYASENIKIIEREIRKFFGQTFRMTFETLSERLNKFLKFEIVQALANLTSGEFKITDRFGFKQYLINKGNVFFLAKSQSRYDSIDCYYIQYPNVSTAIPFQKFVSELYNRTIPTLLNQIKNSQYTQRLKLLEKFEYKNILIENAISRNYGLENDPFCSWVIDFFKQYIFDLGEYVILTLNTKNFRCFDKETRSWDNCSNYVVTSFNNLQSDIKEKSKSKYYGTTKDDKFAILDQTTLTKKESEDKRQLSTGRVCKSIKKIDLLKIILELGMPKNTKQNKITEGYTKDAKEIIEQLLIDDEKVLDILRSYQNENAESLCNSLQAFFEENKLMLTNTQK